MPTYTHHVHGDKHSPCDDARSIAAIALDAQAGSIPDAIVLIEDYAWTDDLASEATEYLCDASSGEIAALMTRWRVPR